MSEILKKLDQVQNEMPQATGTPAPAPAENTAASSAMRSAMNATSAAKKTLRNAEFLSRQLTGRFMSAVRKKMGSAAKRPARLKTLLLASFASGFFLLLLLVFFLPSGPGKRGSSRTRTTVQAPKKAAPVVANSATNSATNAQRNPAMAGGRPTVPNSAAPTEKELQLVKSMEDLVKGGKIDPAITQLEREIGSNPFLTRALFTLASLYEKKNQQDKATATLMRVLQIEPKNALAYNNLGMIQLKLKRYNEAVVFLEKACDYAPKTPEPWLNMGIAYEQKLRWSDSVRAYQHFIELLSTAEAKSTRTPADEKIIAAVNIRLLRLRAFSAADDRRIASIGAQEDEEEQVEDPRQVPETSPSPEETHEVDPKPITQAGGKARVSEGKSP
jgi:Tfp pilus assembly protein PilF